MRRRDKTGGNVAKMQRRKTLRRRNAPKAVRRRRHLTPGKETNVARLNRERDEALEQLAATTEVLRVISSSPGELTPMFQSMLENAVRICGASFGNLLLYENDAFRHVALHSSTIPTVRSPSLLEQKRSFTSPTSLRNRPILSAMPAWSPSLNLVAHGRFWPCQCSRRTN